MLGQFLIICIFSRSKFYKKKKYDITGDVKKNENVNEMQQNIKLDKCAIIDEE